MYYRKYTKGNIMKKLLVIALMMGNNGIQAMSNLDFTRKFGPNSTIYNTPLYFGKGRSANENKKTIRRYKRFTNKKSRS